MRLVVLLVILTVVFAVLAACSDESSEPVTAQRASPPPPPPAPEAAAIEPTNGGSEAGREVEVKLTDAEGLGPFTFAPEEFSFDAGEAITFVFESESQLHTFTVEDLEIDVAVPGLEVVEFSYTFDKPGEYELICIPHSALGMVGTISVK